MDRSSALVLDTYCSVNSSDAGRRCSGSVRWELATLNAVSSKEKWRKDLTAFAKGGPTLTLSGNAIPATYDYAVFGIIASGQLSVYHISVVVHISKSTIYRRIG